MTGMSHLKHESRKGFTLIEVMLTMSLFAIISFLASPFYGHFIFTRELPVVSEELRGSLAKAKLYSMQSKNASSWGVGVSDSRIVLFRGDSFGGREQSFDQTFDIHPKITVSGLETGVIFARTTGRPMSQPTIVVSGNGETETFTINSEGVLEVQ